MSNPKTQISAIPPDGYGDRFINFITGSTMTEAETERKKTSEADPTSQAHDHSISALDGSTTSRSLDAIRRSSHSDRLPRSPVDKTMEKALKQAEKSERKGANEQAISDRTLSAVRSPSTERSHGQGGSTLPVVEEAGEAGSTGGRSGGSIGENAIDEKERGRSRDECLQGGIRRVVSGDQQPMSEKTDGFQNASVLPVITTKPTLMDPEKNPVGVVENSGKA